MKVYIILFALTQHLNHCVNLLRTFYFTLCVYHLTENTTENYKSRQRYENIQESCTQGAVRITLKSDLVLKRAGVTMMMIG